MCIELTGFLSSNRTDGFRVNGTDRLTGFLTFHHLCLRKAESIKWIHDVFAVEGLRSTLNKLLNAYCDDDIVAPYDVLMLSSFSYNSLGKTMQAPKGVGERRAMRALPIDVLVPNKDSPLDYWQSHDIDYDIVSALDVKSGDVAIPFFMQQVRMI